MMKYNSSQAGKSFISIDTKNKATRKDITQKATAIVAAYLNGFQAGNNYERAEIRISENDQPHCEFTDDDLVTMTDQPTDCIQAVLQLDQLGLCKSNLLN